MIRTFLLILFLVFYINSVIAQETNDRTEIQEADTEAGAACTNFELFKEPIQKLKCRRYSNHVSEGIT